MSKPVFKAYQQNQAWLIPPSLDDLIDSNHPVRVVSEVIDSIDIDMLIAKYKGGGASSYHPRMLLKVLVYSYLNNIYSSRKMEAALKENIHFMWLSGMVKPDHHTLNRFRSERLRNILREVFSQIVLLLVDTGQVNLKEVYTDGTKIQSAANRYTFVWGRAINTSKARIKQQLRELWQYTQKLASEEKGDDTPPDFDKIDPKDVKALIENLNTTLKGIDDVDPKIKAKLNYAKKHWPSRLRQYARQQKLLKGRNSYSKTDPGATFMRMKEDHMRNGQLKPGYNAQISTNGQFVVNYTLHQNPTDVKTLIPHLKMHEKLYGHLPEVQVTDAGYGSQENYQYLQSKDVEAYIKPFDFDRKQRKNYHPKNPFLTENLTYDQKHDIFLCPASKPMKLVGSAKKKEAGITKTYTYYQASGCKGCPLKGNCHDQKGNRIIWVNHQKRILNQQAHERLKTEKGIYYRKRRPVDVEPVFGNIKSNKGFTRFMLKGIEKTEIEWGLLCIAHNISKIAV